VTLRAARAADVLWTVPDGDWAQGSNWSTGAPPGPTDAALFNLNAGAGVTPTAHVTSDAGGVTTLSLANGNRVNIENGGALAVNGGSNPSAGVRIGDGSVGSLNLAGVARLTTTSGDVGGDFHVGMGDGGIGTLNVNAGALVSPRDLVVGDATGVGVVNQTGGTVTAGGPGNGALVVGRDGGNGTYNLSGGTLNNQATGSSDVNFMIGIGGGSGKFVMTGGTVNVTAGTSSALGTFTVARGPGSKGTFEMSGGTLHTTGAFRMASYESIGVGDMTGTATQTGGQITADRWVSVAEGGVGTYNLSGGRLVAADDFNISDIDNSHGTLNLSGTGYAQGSTVYVAKSPGGVGVVNQTGGTMVAAGLMLADNATASGTYNLSGGVLDMHGGGIVLGFNGGHGAYAFNMTGGELKNPAGFGFPFVQQGGTLYVGDADDIGKLGLAFDYTLGPNAIIDFDIRGSLDQFNLDQVHIEKNGVVVTLQGKLQTHVTINPTPGQQFTIIHNNFGAGLPIVGSFDGLPEGSIFESGGARFQITYAGGAFGHDVVLTALATPEPGTLGLLGVAAVALVGVRRRRAEGF
jgi:hypothetical protein